MLFARLSMNNLEYFLNVEKKHVLEKPICPRDCPYSTGAAVDPPSVPAATSCTKLVAAWVTGGVRGPAWEIEDIFTLALSLFCRWISSVRSVIPKISSWYLFSSCEREWYKMFTVWDSSKYSFTSLYWHISRTWLGYIHSYILYTPHCCIYINIKIFEHIRSFSTTV